MTIRRIDRTTGPFSSSPTRAVRGEGDEHFAEYMDSLASLDGAHGLDRVEGVTERERRSHRDQDAQLDDADALLETLEALGRSLEQGGDDAVTVARLQESRDQALSTLSNTPRGGEERELLLRTAVLATVELAKNDRGDYR